MDNRSFESASSASPPSAPASPSVGYPTNGNPSLAIPATIPGDYWFYQMGEELRAVIVAAGLTPDRANLNQLSNALTLLGLQDATEILKGRLELATAIEVAALTDAVRAITPAGLASVFTKSHASSGYQKLPGGLIIQWGTATSSGTGPSNLTWTLPVAFPTDTYSFLSLVAGGVQGYVISNGATLSAWTGTVYGTADTPITGASCFCFAIGK